MKNKFQNYNSSSYKLSACVQSLRMTITKTFQTLKNSTKHDKIIVPFDTHCGPMKTAPISLQCLTPQAMVAAGFFTHGRPLKIGQDEPGTSADSVQEMALCTHCEPFVKVIIGLQ